MSRIARAGGDSGRRDELRFREQDRRMVRLAGDAQGTARGVVAFEKRPAGSGVALSGATPAVILTTSASVIEGRRYRVEFAMSAYADGAGSTGLETRIGTALDATADTASPVLAYVPFVLLGSSQWDHMTSFGVYDAPSDGDLSVILWASGAAGRTYGIVGNATAEARLMVSDVGRAL